jgi:chemotaxis protein MotB
MLMRASLGRRPREKTQNDYTDTKTRWLVTYSDLITLLMAFFVMLYAMSVVNRGKFNELLISMRSGFGRDDAHIAWAQHKDTRPASRPETPDGDKRPSLDIVPDIETAVRKHLPQSQQKNIEFTTQAGMVKVRICGDRAPFAHDSSQLRPHAKRALRAIGTVIRDLPYHYRIEGHTCDLPGHPGADDYKWQLSVRRAVRVLMFLSSTLDIPQDAFSAAGYADTRPIVPNTSESNRRRNERVEIALLTEGRQPATGPVAPAVRPRQPEVRPQPVRIVPDVNGTLSSSANSYETR